MPSKINSIFSIVRDVDTAFGEYRALYVDLDTAEVQSARSSRDFKDALNTGTDLLNAVSRHFDGFEVSRTIAPAPGGQHSLLLAIKRAHEAKAQDSFKYHMGFERKQRIGSSTPKNVSQP